MKKKRYVILVLIGFLLFMAGYLTGLWRGGGKTERQAEHGGELFCTVVRSTDTMEYKSPLPKGEVTTGRESYRLAKWSGERRRDGFVKANLQTESKPRGERTDRDPGEKRADSDPGGERVDRDSVTVELPVVQRHYADSSYEAWVSGPLSPRLDSIRVFSTNSVITRVIRKDTKDLRKRWHIGVSAGYGYGAKGFQPYIGAGITYSIFSF